MSDQDQEQNQDLQESFVDHSSSHNTDNVDDLSIPEKEEEDDNKDAIDSDEGDAADDSSEKLLEEAELGLGVTTSSSAEATSSSEEAFEDEPIVQEQEQKHTHTLVETVEEASGSEEVEELSSQRGSNADPATDEESMSEYEEDLFPDGQGEGRMRSPTSASASPTGDTDESGSGSDFLDNNNNSSAWLNKSNSQCTFVSPAVWARTWEERAEQFKTEHPEEYKEVELKMKKREIERIELERDQRIHENKEDLNVKRFMRTLGGASCAICCLTILMLIIIAVILKDDVDAPPAPTAPPLGAPISVVTTAEPEPTAAATTLAPTNAPVDSSLSTNASTSESGNGNGNETSTSG